MVLKADRKEQHHSQFLLFLFKFFFIFVLGTIPFLSGCVTTVEGPFTLKVNTPLAEKKYVELGLAYLQRGQYENARKYLQRALKINSDSDSAYAAMGLLYQQQGEYKLAEQQFLKALDINNDYTRGRAWYAAFLYSQGRYKEAMEQFQIASKDTSYDSRSQIFINIGHTAERLKQYKLAKGSYLKVIAMNPGSLKPLVDIIDLSVRLNDFLSARRYYSHLQEMVRNRVVKQTQKTLELGFLIAHHFKNKDEESSFLLLLKNLYPESDNYHKYKAMLGNE